jgi:ectoine hydroxylase-related dioxygenase (phytanoyl-CoA dioxygenase family)
VRAIHRGTPNRTSQPRPMVVLGYSRRWLWRPEVHIDVPRTVLDAMPPRLQALLRFNPVLDAGAPPTGERYQNFMY